MLTVYNQNLHTHGVLCDGKDAYEDTVKRALELGFDSIGFSGHSYTPYALQFCMTPENTEKYKAEIYRLKEKYRGQIDIFCGLEYDMYSDVPKDGYEYIIGSFHYFKIDGEYVGFDRSADEVQRIIDEYFGGDGMKYAKRYYEDLVKLPDYVPCDIIGHMDLVAKHNFSRHYFDTESKEYRGYVADALDALKGRVEIFEINTGCISRGYRPCPYPELFILKELRKRGFQIVISSDCHDNRYLNCAFDEALQMARESGYKEVMKLTNEGFKAFSIV